MNVLVDSVEYQCWHEVGHATACLHFGGHVELIEFLEGHERGFARTSCIVTPEIERRVACGGFAAEFYLLNNGYAQKSREDDRDISRIVFHNATADREAFWDRRLREGEIFTVEEDTAFMEHAIGLVIPIFDLYFSRMQVLVRELFLARVIQGPRVKELLQLRLPAT